MTDELNKEIRTLKMQIAKLQLESKLRRNLASELDKQKQIAKNAEELALNLLSNSQIILLRSHQFYIFEVNYKNLKLFFFHFVDSNN